MSERYAYIPETLGKLWSVSAATVRNRVRRGDLKAFRIGRQLRIRPEHVEEYERRSTDPSPPADVRQPPEPPKGGRSALRRDFTHQV